MINVDWKALEGVLVQRGVDALNITAQYTLNRAQHYAPVRKIFRAGRRRRRLGELRFRSVGDMDALRRSTPRIRQIRAPGQVRVLGHANSLMPVLRFGNSLATGDFRRYDRANQSLREVTATVRRANGKVRLEETDAEAFLSGRGRYEVRTARAAFRTIKTSIDPLLGKVRVPGAERIGGRLRGELYVVGASLARTVIWAHVVSPTPYARYQEFQTRHNRAHPFLRPALYDSRRVLVANVKRAYNR